jgi:hypothetical protein
MCALLSETVIDSVLEARQLMQGNEEQDMDTVEKGWRTWNSSLCRWIMLSDRVTPISLQKLLMACGPHTQEP